MKLLIENWRKHLEEASYSQHQGGWYGTGETASEEAEEDGLTSDDRISIDVEWKEKLDELGMDWILDPDNFNGKVNIEDDLDELAKDVASPSEYKQKVKDYLNSKEDLGHEDLGDAVFADEAAEEPTEPPAEEV